MAKITLKGNPVTTIGNLPEVGSKIKPFTLVKTDLGTATHQDFENTNLVLNIFPSIDTGTCATSVRTFNQKAAELENTKVLCISRDLPFAQARFCGAEGIENVVMLSDFRTGQFSKDNGLEIVDGPLTGLCSRSIIVVNAAGEVVYTEQVAETVDEPNYQRALASLQ